MDGLHFYKAFGLCIRSEIELAELELATPGPFDLTIALGTQDRPPPESYTRNTFEFSDEQCFMCWPAVGSFLITGTDRIDIQPAADVDRRWIPFPLLGPVMSVLLHRRGMLVLHGSAVAIGDDAVIFAGDKMAGKSTTAAAFLRAGHRLVTDDVVAIQFTSDGAVIEPGFAQIKLAEDAETAIELAGAQRLPILVPGFEKRQSRLAGEFSLARIRPRRMFVLDRGLKAEIDLFDPIAALKAVMRFSHIIRFSNSSMASSPEHFANCARFANLVDVCRLEVPTGLDHIDEAVHLVESDLARKALKVDKA